MERASSEPTDDLPGWELAFRFTSDRLCLALCATVGERWRRNFDRVRVCGDLGRWVRASGLLRIAPPVSQQQLDQARLLREAIYRAVRAGMVGTHLAEADRKVLNDWARTPALAPQMAADGTCVTWSGADPLSAALATVARDAIELLTSTDITRVRECAADDCALLFFDHSRPGRRRWCADRACGTKSRSASYRRRHQTATLAREHSVMAQVEHDATPPPTSPSSSDS